MTAETSVKVLIITGYGLNCEAETAHAFTLAGAQPEQVHLSDLLAGERQLSDYHIIAFIGGFAFGDHIGAGTVFSTRVKYRLKDALDAFILDGRLIIGICNGFQTLVKLGLLPGFDGDFSRRLVTLSWNDSGVFRDDWVRLRATPDSPCVFTRGLELLDLPIRHGEGRFVPLDDSVLERIVSENMVALSYADPETGRPTETFPHNPNGSVQGIAGICDPTGRIFGLMPHPEAYLSPLNHPQWTRRKLDGTLPEDGEGLALFKNAVDFARENLL